MLKRDVKTGIYFRISENQAQIIYKVYSCTLQDLGAAAGSKRPTCVILIKPNSEYEDSYNECVEEVQALPLPY